MMILSLYRSRLRLFHNNTTILILMLVYLKIEEISNRLCSLHYVLTTKGMLESWFIAELTSHCGIK